MANPANEWQNDPVKVARVRQMHEDHAWVNSHYDEMDRQYHGEYVVVWKKHVVAHGMDLGDLLQRAATAERPREELVIVGFPAFFESPH
jgi:hypothetical protein